MIKDKILDQKHQLVEKLGVYMENEDNLAPLEARIFATLILTGKGGISFENLVQDLNASKSTICTHLNKLQASNRVSYHTKPGDRKRYFNVIPNRLVLVMNDMLQKWNEQYTIHSEIIEYKKNANEQIAEDSEKMEIQFHEKYLEFLEEVSNSVKKLKNNISQL